MGFKIVGKCHTTKQKVRLLIIAKTTENIDNSLHFSSTMPNSNFYTALCRWAASLCFALFFSAFLAPFLAAQNRAVAVVYDNSGSMRDAGQCDGINYALQVMVGLLHSQDELYVYKMDSPNGHFMNLNDKHNTIKNINTVYDCKAKATPFEAVINAKNKLSQSSRKDKWLLILSDGMITDKQFIAKYTNDLRSFVEQTGSRIIFLNVSAANTPLDQYFSQTQTPQQTQRTDGNFTQIIKTMENIGATVMTLSGGGVPFKPVGTKLQINTPLPLKKIIVLEQEARKNTVLPTVKNATSSGKNLWIEDTYTAQKANANYQMTGLITHISADKTANAIIPKGAIDIDFTGLPDPSKVKILPEVAAKLVVDIEGSVKSKSGNQQQICDTVRQVRVIARLLDLKDQPLDLPVLQGSRLWVMNETNHQKQAMSLDEKNSRFSTTIPLSSNHIVLSVTAEYAGYFNFQSQVINLHKDACPIPKANLEASKTKITASVLAMDAADYITVFPRLSVGDAQARPPTEAEMKDLYIEQSGGTEGISLSIDNMPDGSMRIRPKGAWCACFTRTGKSDIGLQLKSRNPNIQIGSKNNLTVSVEITDAPFWAKCGWLIIATLSALLVLWYIVGLIKKPRFCRGSEVVFSRTTPLQTQKARSYPLPTGFLNRYLVPYIAEQQVVGTVKFRAGARCSHILIDKSAQTDNMFVSGFPIENPRVKDIRLSNGEKLEVARAGQSKETYEYRKL